MKFLVTTLLALISSFTLIAKDKVLVLSSDSNPQTLDRAFELCTNAVIDGSTGDEICIYDGYLNKSVAYLTIPDTENPKFRFKLLGNEWGEVIKWFKEHASQKNSGNMGSVIDLPSFLNSYHRYLAENSTVVIVGNPLYISASDGEKGFNFISDDGVPRWPTISNLLVDLKYSPFSVRGMGRRIPAGTQIHWLNPIGSRLFQTTIAEESIRRFWSLYIGHQSGKNAGLVSFHSDWNRLLLDLKGRTPLEPFDDRITNEERDNMDMIGMMTVLREGGEHRIVVNRVNTANLNDVLPPDPATQIICFDRTKSMSDEFDRCAEYISYLPEGERYLLLTYSDYHHPQVVKTQYEGREVHEMALSLRSVELESGDDNPEAMEYALYVAAKRLRESGVRAGKVYIFADAPPHQPADSPKAFDAGAIITKLLSDGHYVELIPGGDMDMSWLPQGVIINDAVKHP